jgi:aryl-alcohol dehydrogenase-like predicted oxidoreductase
MTLSPADYQDLGSTGIRVSPIGLGTVKFGRNTDVKYPTAFDLPDDDQLRELLATARDGGINLIDTAPAYGASEERLGRLLRGQRDHWVLCTKVGEHYSAATSSYDFSAEATRRSVERSLHLLQTDHIDIVLVHSDGSGGETHAEALSALAALKQRGDICAFGISTRTVAGGLKAIPLVDLLMVAYSLDDTSQREVLDAARQNAKGVLVKKALSSGHARDPGSALCFSLAHPAVASVIVGTINPHHLRANINAVG